jgi:hypothetical protein
MKITLGTFARIGIESELGPDVAATARAALFHYTSKLESGRPPVAPPRFFAPSELQGGEEALELNLDPEVEAMLEREAARQGTDLDALTAHSVLLYLAEFDFLGTSSQPV